MQTYLFHLLEAVGLQLVSVLGIFFVIGFILSKIEEWTQTNYRRSVGWQGILWTAWLGTPFHEISHLIFAKLFRHKIVRVALFEPNQQTGELGAVEHAYNPRSLYQNIGNFFIGAAPTIGGAIALAVLMYVVVPNGKMIISPLIVSSFSIQSLVLGVGTVLSHLFSAENIHTWYFWLFIYISSCIACHMAPSKMDRKGMWSGLVYITLLLIVINLICALFHYDPSAVIMAFGSSLSFIIALFLYATIISIANLILSWIILTPFRLLKR